MYIYLVLSLLEFIFEPVGMVLRILLELSVARLASFSARMLNLYFPLCKLSADFKVHQIFRAFNVLYWMFHLLGQEAHYQERQTRQMGALMGPLEFRIATSWAPRMQGAPT